MGTKRNNGVNVQQAEMNGFGLRNGDAEKSKIDAGKYFGGEVCENRVELPARDHADFAKSLDSAAFQFATWFCEGRSQKLGGELPTPASIKTYANQFKLFAAPKVHENIAAIEAAVNAFTVGKTKAKMEGKTSAEVFRAVASAVRKGKLDPAGITPVLIKKAIKPSESSGTPKAELSPADKARAAFTTGLKAMLAEGGLSKAGKAKLQEIAKTLKIDL
jgi:hypothetical protein